MENDKWWDLLPIGRTLKYISSQSIKLYTHKQSACSLWHCPVHNPSDHLMKDFPTQWDENRSIMTRVCPHGIAHPDPDDLKYNDPFQSKYAGKWDHGCDGCCQNITEKEELSEEYID